MDKEAHPARQRGWLAAQVREVLRSRPDHAFSVGEVCRSLDGVGYGGVANALLVLHRDGHARLVETAPDRYQHAASEAASDRDV